MRESSGSRTFSVTVTGPVNPSPSRLQHGSPVTGGASAVLPMQVASGMLPAFCEGGAGTPYSSVLTSENVRWRSGVDENSDLVFDRFHETIEVAVPSFVNTARELTKCSVPPPEPSNWSSGVTAGITEKPVPPSGPPGLWPFVLTIVTGTDDAPEASRNFGSA